MQVTLLDNNQEAFRLYRTLSGHGTYVCADAFAYQPEAPFDSVFSDGIIEHFHAPERAALLRVHRELVSCEGAVVIFVPKDTWFIRNVFKMRGGLELKYTFPRLEAELRAAGLTPVARAEDWHVIGVTCRKAQHASTCTGS